jgi:hypothetical protein
VGRRRTNTALSGRPAPIFARTMWRPRGVQRLPFFSPAPRLAVDTEYDFTILPRSRSVSVCCGMLISILIGAKQKTR